MDGGAVPFTNADAKMLDCCFEIVTGIIDGDLPVENPITLARNLSSQVGPGAGYRWLGVCYAVAVQVRFLSIPPGVTSTRQHFPSHLTVARLTALTRRALGVLGGAL